eukprot:2757745-Karenia_brevis.AAC.1
MDEEGGKIYLRSSEQAIAWVGHLDGRAKASFEKLVALEEKEPVEAAAEAAAERETDYLQHSHDVQSFINLLDLGSPYDALRPGVIAHHALRGDRFGTA